ncbi:hypothetical protein PENSPDRAFT_753332 [Peniophora sp. CONT]|nr:hypothetical protein PENSPDRAFT_753332 [Peniophora sp. CONT]
MSSKPRARGTYKAPVHRALDPLLILPGSHVADKTERDVNHRLHALRGEHFRHDLNIRRALAASTRATPRQSLPYGQIFGTGPQEPVTESSMDVPLTPNTAGPVPKSWVPMSESHEPDFDSPSWRAAALELFLDDGNSASTSNSSTNRHGGEIALLSLPLLCVRSLLATYGSDAESIAALRPYLPPAARRILLRDTAVHEPLSSSALAALLAPDGHAGGEVVIVGPGQVLKPELLRAGEPQQDGRVETSEPVRMDAREEWRDEDEEDSWDAPTDGDLYTASGLALLRAPLPVRLLPSLPATLTRLSLIALPSPAPLHRLPGACPLLELLDLGWNTWLAKPAWGEDTALARIRWERWTRLRVLGVRETGLDAESKVLRVVNEGRWVEGMEVVEIIA